MKGKFRILHCTGVVVDYEIDLPFPPSKGDRVQFDHIASQCKVDYRTLVLPKNSEPYYSIGVSL